MQRNQIQPDRVRDFYRNQRMERKRTSPTNVARQISEDGRFSRADMREWAIQDGAVP